MDFMQFFDMILHVDKYLGTVIEQYGTMVYWVLFAIVFCETGLVVVPFLPGDTLLFIGGAFCATGAMNEWLLISLLIVAAGTAPAFLPIAQFASLLRFLGFAGLTYLFMLMTDDGYQLKLCLLVFGITVMMVTSMLAEVSAIPQESIDHCRTLGMKHWRITYELVLLGKADTFLDLIRQNAAIGWTLLTMVEGLTRSQGGVGALLLNQNRYFLLSGVFAIQLTILAYGIAQDYVLGKLRASICPYSLVGRKGSTG